MPATCLIPLADCLNHSKYSIEHFFISKKFETLVDQKAKDYKIKKEHINLSIINDSDFKHNMTEKELKKI